MKNIHIHKKVDKLIFGLMSPKMIKKMASSKIVTPELYDKEGYPVDGGLMDIRLGVIDPGLRCKTCGGKLKECVGHFGYIAIARPVVHIKFKKIILKILRGTCRECSRVLVSDSDLKNYVADLKHTKKARGYEAKRKLVRKIVKKIRKTKKCPHCKAEQQKIKIEKPTTYLENDKRISPIEIRSRLEKVPDKDCEIFGLNPIYARPEWMILTVFAIPPVTMRPSITLESGERSEDDLTHKLGDVVRINQRLFENINAGAPEIIIEDLWDLLQYHITTFFDNNVAQLPPARHRSGQPLKTITNRIKSKQGRIRKNLAGKRTNFSARTVISPDSMLKLNQVGVPNIMAKKLTIPERVTEWNMKYLKEFVDKGPEEYPGANYVIRPDGKKKRITDETREALLEELQPGYLVERHLMDGDVVIFNRQPSLHRMSMMCHRVKVLPYKTLRLNPAVCHPYNADFDGDEMNLHVPQTEESRAEAEILMEVQTQIISPRYGLSVIGCLQDAIAGNYLLTKEMEFTKDEAISLLASIGVNDFSEIYNKTKVSGKEVFSVLLPEDFNFDGESKDRKPVKIKKGLLIEGHMDKALLGHGAGMLLRQYHKQYGQKATLELVGNIFRLGVKVLFRRGFTTLISDSDLPENAVKDIQKIINQSEKDVAKLIEKFEQGKLEPLPGRTKKETLEAKIIELLNKTRDNAGKVVAKYAKKDNHFLVMTQSGARGNPLNLAQVASCVGQQALRGKRIDRGYKKRTLSAFTKNDFMPDARGFIRNGYKQGLKPHEFFFGAMTGRDSLMDTALRTPKSGYLYRRLANALQDLKVEYDNTVRDSSKKIIQFKYGEDGIDVSKSEGGTLNLKNIK
ncbi:MAG: DNA-directed RNA polymerase subunit A' [Candidatus Woesearchaeota archaeon]|nr:DNA-directed RNA polymerase subunit A' [Candidatus Woesearchaeota archaeon]